MSEIRDAEREPLLSGSNSTNVEINNVQKGVAPSEAPIVGVDPTDEQDGGERGTDKTKSELEWSTILAIASTWIGVFLASMDSSVLATLTGTISSTYGSSQLITWYINAYMVASALIQPLSGKLSDIFGRKAGLLLANVLFLVGNIICGLAKHDWQFILGRAVQGLGGGSLHSISTFLISDFVPLRSRGFWQGISNIAYGVGFAFGGVYGGLINDKFGWRWAFLSQPIPILVSIVLVFVLLPNPPPTGVQSFQRIDFLGSMTLTGGLLFLLYGTVSGGNTLPWSSPVVIACFVIAPILIVAFGFVEEKIAIEPVIPVKLLRHRTTLGCCLTNGLCTMGYSSLIFYIPLQLQVGGLSIPQAGWRLAPVSLGTFIGSLGSGILMNVTGKYYILGMVCQCGLIISAAIVVGFVASNIAGAIPFVAMALAGLSFGGSLTITLVALISDAGHEHHAPLTSASYAFRTMGNVLGQAISGAIFQDVFKEQLETRFGGTPGAQDRIEQIRRKFTPIKDLPESWRHDVARSYEVAFNDIWVFFLTSCVIGGLAFAVVRENKLSKTIDRR